MWEMPSVERDELQRIITGQRRGPMGSVDIQAAHVADPNVRRLPKLKMPSTELNPSWYGRPKIINECLAEVIAIRERLS